jgi:hypothetical protein
MLNQTHPTHREANVLSLVCVVMLCSINEMICSLLEVAETSEPAVI